MTYLHAFHLIAVITWFAGIFYLPRLFVYHAQTEDELGLKRFTIMERRLYHGIMTPSALVTFILGLWLTALNWEYYQTAVWFRVKIVLVLALFGYHGICGRFLREFANECNTRTHVFYRWFNEVPFVILIMVVLLVTVKPF